MEKIHQGKFEKTVKFNDFCCKNSDQYIFKQSKYKQINCRLHNCFCIVECMLNHLHQVINVDDMT